MHQMTAPDLRGRWLGGGGRGAARRQRLRETEMTTTCNEHASLIPAAMAIVEPLRTCVYIHPLIKNPLHQLPGPPGQQCSVSYDRMSGWITISVLVQPSNP